jgi:thiamine-phosphate pyrophosphorylase
MMEHNDPRLRLVAITDDLRDGSAGLVTRAQAAERGGATMVLLRLKHVDARTLMEAGQALVLGLSVPVVVAERLDVALACGAAGVHLSATSMPVQAIRPHVPSGFLIGGSISGASDLERTAAADYVTIGPVFDALESGLGVEGFRRLSRAVGRPSLAVGGVTAQNAAEIRAAGASGVAVIRSVFGATDPEGSARQLCAADAADDHAAG